MQSFAESEQLGSPTPPTSGEELATRLGEVLRRRREGLGRSVRAVAERAGMSPAHLSEVERGIKDPSLAKLTSIAGALGVPVGEVVLDLAIALGAAPPRPVRHPLGFAPDPRSELDWAMDRLHSDDRRAIAAFGAFLASRPKGAPPL